VSFSAAVTTLLVVAAALVSCVPHATVRDLVDVEPSSASGAPIVIQNTTVFPATGTERLANFDVIVVGDRIAAVQHTGGVLPENARIIDGAGKTLLPGLIDAHVHVNNDGAVPWAPVEVGAEHNLEAWLYSGVTTVYDLGGEGRSLEALRERLERGLLPGPRLFHTGIPITAPGGHPIPLMKALAPWYLRGVLERFIPQAEGPDDGDALVGEQLQNHADYVKLVRDSMPEGTPVLDDATMISLVRAAHARHKKVFVHIGTVDDALVAAQAGADVLAHGVYRGRVDAAQAKSLAASGVVVIPTLAAFHRIADVAHGRLRASNLDVETVPHETFDPMIADGGARLAALPGMGDMTGQVAASEGEWAANLRALHDAGVPVVPGSDAVLPGVWAGGSLHDELRLLVDAGLSPVDVLLGATSRAAHLFLAEPDFGSIESGKRADLLLVDGDPFTDITATTRIHTVVQAGRLVVRHR
jgi:imidazolonepropionase-like amidohydrolase